MLYSEFLPANTRGRCFSLLAVRWRCRAAGPSDPPSWCVCAPQLIWTLGSMLEIMMALLIMPTLGWRWLLGLTSAPMGVFLIFNHVGAFPVDPCPQDMRAGGDPSLSVLRRCFPRVLALTCCRDAPPRPYRPSGTLPNRTGSPCRREGLLPPKR